MAVRSGKSIAASKSKPTTKVAGIGSSSKPVNELSPLKANEVVPGDEDEDDDDDGNLSYQSL